VFWRLVLILLHFTSSLNKLGMEWDSQDQSETETKDYFMDNFTLVTPI